MKGEKYPKLARALRVLCAADGYGEEIWNAHRIAQYICRNYKDYGLSTSTFDRSGVEKAVQGEPIAAKTAKVLTAFVETIAPELLNASIEDTDLDLDTFFLAKPTETRRKSLALQGRYHVYSASNTVLNHLWIGRMTFDWRARGPRDPRRRLFVHHTAERQRIKSIAAKSYAFEGYAAPRGSRTYFVVLRSVTDFDEGTGILSLLEVLDPGAGIHPKVQRARMHLLQFESELGRHVHCRYVIVRTDEFDQEMRYMPIVDFDDETILNDLGLIEEVEILRRKKDAPMSEEPEQRSEAPPEDGSDSPA